nr:hypothetical protein [Candidatus Sigynarchaeum springense]
MSFHARNKTERHIHEDWIGHFCAPMFVTGCPHCELRSLDDWPVKQAFCKALERFADDVNLETRCPRREELAARRHAALHPRQHPRDPRRRQDAAHGPRERTYGDRSSPTNVCRLLAEGQGRVLGHRGPGMSELPYFDSFLSLFPFPLRQARGCGTKNETASSKPRHRFD